VLVTVLPLDPASTDPLYEQLRSQIAARATSGELPAGTRLPTVRQLAVDLGIGVRTVQRVYTELEADGIVVTEGRRGTFVASPSAPGRTADAVEAADAYAVAARRLGLTLAEATRVLTQRWGGSDVGGAG